MLVTQGEKRAFFDGKKPMITPYISLFGHGLRDTPVSVDGTTLYVKIYGESGPMKLSEEEGVHAPLYPAWRGMSMFEREKRICQIARETKIQMDAIKNRATQLALESAQKEADEKAAQKRKELADTLEREDKEWKLYLQEPYMVKCSSRCEQEKNRKVPAWQPITQDTVNEGHDKASPGMIYGIEFPWSAETLEQYGVEWLTKAYHTARTLSEDNRVTKLIFEQDVKITSGNNGGKFLFELEYLKPDADLNKRMFAKVPFALTQKLKSDRMSSSVNKQSQELYEINTYRLLEATLPVRIPKYYFGDISNTTSNFIIITERVEFADHAGSEDFGTPKPRRPPLAPFAIEGPYDKCVDWHLRGEPSEYYYLLLRVGAQMAGRHKAGLLGDETVLQQNFVWAEGRPKETFGMNEGPSGEPPNQLATKLDLAIRFVSETGKVLFPSYVSSDKFKVKMKNTLLTLNDYMAEIEYWKHANPAYVAMLHTNINVDNSYFWRDDQSRLRVGIFDWGFMGSSPIGHKLWWWLYCADYDVLNANVDGFLDCFIQTYNAAGGPMLDFKELKNMFMVTAMQQLIQLCAAVPQIMRMCPAKEWPSIQDRYDQRIGENIDGKSTIRLYLHVMNSVMRIIEEWRADQVLDKWIKDFYCTKMKMKRKKPSSG